MWVYFLRRLMIMIPTLFGITLVCFIIINLAPGSPVEQKLQALRMGSRGGSHGAGVSQEVIDALNKQYGFDKPLPVRYAIWMKNLAHLDFGQSFAFEEPAIDVITRKFPISLMFGIVSLILTYLICVPLGVLKAIKDESGFDTFSSFILFVMLSIPSVVLAVLLVVFFAGGSYFNWFPIGGLSADNYDSLSTMGQIWDRVHHMCLPLICYTISSFTFLTLLMKNSMLDVIRLDYVRTARAKGLSEGTVYMKHALRNALIPIVTGLSGILAVFFAGSIIIERIFQLDGIGNLTLTSINARDYNVIMGLIFIESALLLAGRLIADMLYVVVDPRIDFQ